MNASHLIPFSASKGETASHQPIAHDAEISIIEASKRDMNHPNELVLSEFDFSDQLSSNLPFQAIGSASNSHSNRQPHTAKQHSRKQRLQQQRSYIVGSSSQSPDVNLIKSFAEQDKELHIPSLEDD